MLFKQFSLRAFPASRPADKNKILWQHFLGIRYQVLGFRFLRRKFFDSLSSYNLKPITYNLLLLIFPHRNLSFNLLYKINDDRNGDEQSCSSDSQRFYSGDRLRDERQYRDEAQK